MCFPVTRTVPYLCCTTLRVPPAGAGQAQAERVLPLDVVPAASCPTGMSEQQLRFDEQRRKADAGCVDVSLSAGNPF